MGEKNNRPPAGCREAARVSVFGYQALGRGTDAPAGVPLPGAGGVGAAAPQGGAGRRWRPQGVKRLEAPTEPTGETTPLDGAQRRKNGGLLRLAIRRSASQSAQIHGRQAMYRSAPLVPKGFSVTSS